MPMKFVCGVLMLTSLVWPEKLCARRIVEGFLAVKHGVQGVEWPTKGATGFYRISFCVVCAFLVANYADSLNPFTHRFQRVWQLCSLLRRIAGAYFWSVDNLHQRDRDDCADCRLLGNDRANADGGYHRTTRRLSRA